MTEPCSSIEAKSHAPFVARGRSALVSRRQRAAKPCIIDARPFDEILDDAGDDRFTDPAERFSGTCLELDRRLERATAEGRSAVHVHYLSLWSMPPACLTR